MGRAQLPSPQAWPAELLGFVTQLGASSRAAGERVAAAEAAIFEAKSSSLGAVAPLSALLEGAAPLRETEGRLAALEAEVVELQHELTRTRDEVTEVRTLASAAAAAASAAAERAEQLATAPPAVRGAAEERVATLESEVALVQLELQKSKQLEAAASQQLIKKLEAQVEQWRLEARSVRELRKTAGDELEMLKQRVGSSQAQLDTLLKRGAQREELRARGQDAAAKNRTDLALRQRLQVAEDGVSSLQTATGQLTVRMGQLEEQGKRQAQKAEGLAAEQRGHLQQLFEAQTGTEEGLVRLSVLLEEVRERAEAASRVFEASTSPSASGEPATPTAGAAERSGRLASDSTLRRIGGSERWQPPKRPSVASPRSSMTTLARSPARP